MLSRFKSLGNRQATINDQRVTVGANESILQAALRDGIDFPHLCRVGGCGACKCKLKSGKVRELTETGYLLSQREIEDNFILACQSRPKSDIEVEFDDSATPKGEQVFGEIIAREFLTHDIVRIDAQLREPINYKAGQFAEVAISGLPGVTRSYSFSNAPDASGLVSFTIRKVANGQFSNHVFDTDVIGAQITVRGPAGSFYLRQRDNENAARVLMVAGGSGLAPIMAILEEMNRRADYRPVTLLFGARQEKDLYELETIKQYVENWPDFQFVPVLSDDAYNENWQGAEGLVTEHLNDQIGNIEAAYLCGPPAMVDSANAALIKLGVNDEQIFADRFIVQEHNQAGFYGALGLPTVERVPATVADYLKFTLIHVTGVSAVLMLLAGGTGLAVGLIALLLVYSVGDSLAVEDKTTPGYAQPWILTLQLWMALPLISLVVFCFLWSVASGDPLGFGAWVHGWSGIDVLANREASNNIQRYFAGTMAAGFLIGLLATITAHELTHRTWDPVSVLVGRWLLAFSFDAGFAIEHVYGHHRYVSTEEDPATAPRGRNVYAHIVISTWTGNISAAKIEAQRLKRKGYSVLSWRNAYIRGLMMSALLLVAAYMIAGWKGALLFTATGLFAKALLEIVNYMEHYGMVRLPDQPVRPRHSWNTTSMMSSWTMFNLGRHSHHHAQGEIPFQDLMPLDDAPRMRFGYLSTIFLTLVPPLWNSIMAEKLKAWDRDFASTEERELAHIANQKSGMRQLLDYDPRDLALQ